MKRTILLVLAGGLLAGSTGCADLQPLLYRPFGSRLMCNMDHCVGGCGPICQNDCGPTCESACGPTCESACGPTSESACGPTCQTDCEPMCGDVGDSSCAESRCPTCGHGCGGQCGPISSLAFRLLNPETWCGPSCGDIYLGDFYGDPPDLCDPCDWGGNYTPVHVDGFIDGCGSGCLGGCDGGRGGGCDGGFSHGYTEGGARDCNCARHSSASAPMTASRTVRPKSASRAAPPRTTARW